MDTLIYSERPFNSASNGDSNNTQVSSKLQRLTKEKPPLSHSKCLK